LSDPTSPDTPVPFVEWFDSHFRHSNGKTYSAQTRRKFVRLYHFPIIDIGKARLIVPRAGDAHLASIKTRFQEEPLRRRPGRPRKYVAD
jgi:hypothetical protein